MKVQRRKISKDWSDWEGFRHVVEFKLCTSQLLIKLPVIFIGREEKDENSEY